ncbi:MAG: cell division protein ZapA [Fretibacterium sp.]|nr:cell division protein ZapA [Fretibacterium sp.]
MNRPQDVRIRLGKRTYSVKTPLDERTMARLEALIHTASPKAEEQFIEQEHLLMLTCLKLAYDLDTASQSLSELLSRLEEEPRGQDKEKHS